MTDYHRFGKLPYEDIVTANDGNISLGLPREERRRSYIVIIGMLTGALNIKLGFIVFIFLEKARFNNHSWYAWIDSVRENYLERRKKRHQDKNQKRKNDATWHHEEGERVKDVRVDGQGGGQSDWTMEQGRGGMDMRPLGHGGRGQGFVMGEVR